MKYMDCNTLNSINHRNLSIGSLIQLSSPTVHLAEHITKYNNTLGSCSRDSNSLPQATQEHSDSLHYLML